MERRESFKIVIRRVEKPLEKSFEKDFDWMCRSLGFFEQIDKEKTASTVLREVVRAACEGKPITSSSLAGRIEMSRGSVINHLNNLIKSGLIVKDGRFYYPRSRSIYRTIQEIEEDVDRIFRRMEETAKRIDKKFGIGLK